MEGLTLQRKKRTAVSQPCDESQKNRDRHISHNKHTQRNRRHTLRKTARVTKRVFPIIPETSQVTQGTEFLKNISGKRVNTPFFSPQPFSPLRSPPLFYYCVCPYDWKGHIASHREFSEEQVSSCTGGELGPPPTFVYALPLVGETCPLAGFAVAVCFGEKASQAPVLEGETLGRCFLATAVGWSWALFFCHDVTSTAMTTAPLPQVLVDNMQSPASFHPNPVTARRTPPSPLWAFPALRAWRRSSRGHCNIWDGTVEPQPSSWTPRGARSNSGGFWGRAGVRHS